MKDSNYYSCVLDFLKSHSLPLTGWYNVGVTEMDEEVRCEVCGCHDPAKVSVIRRVCGYLGAPDARPFNNSKQEEVMERVKHVDDGAEEMA